MNNGKQADANAVPMSTKYEPHADSNDSIYVNQNNTDHKLTQTRQTDRLIVLVSINHGPQTVSNERKYICPSITGQQTDRPREQPTPE